MASPKGIAKKERPTRSLAGLLHHQPAFRAFLRKRLPDDQLVEDLLHEGLLSALKHGGQLRDQERIVPWFYKILRRAVVDYYRRRDADARRDEKLLQDWPLTDELPAETKRQICGCMKRMLPGLHPNYRLVLEQVDLAERPVSAVARRLGISINTLSVRLHRARQALKKSLKGFCGSCATEGCLDCSCQHPGV